MIVTILTQALINNADFERGPVVLVVVVVLLLLAVIAGVRGSCKPGSSCRNRRSSGDGSIAGATFFADGTRSDASHPLDGHEGSGHDGGGWGDGGGSCGGDGGGDGGGD